MSTRKIDDDIRNTYPYPLAATFHRAYYDSRDISLIHDFLADLAEVALKYLASCVLAQYIHDGGDDLAINGSLQNLQRPTLDHWRGWLQDTLHYYEQENRALLMPEIATFYKQSNSSAVLTAYNELGNMMREKMELRGFEQEREQVSLCRFLDLLVEYRNRAAQAAKLSLYERREIVDWLLPALREMFVALDFTSRYRLVFINEVKLAGSRRDVVYEHFITDLTGYKPSVIGQPFVLPKPAGRPGELHVCAADQDFAPLFSLHPFLVYRYCRDCSDNQAFALRLNRENNLVYYSYQCSHQFGLTEYLDDIRIVLGALTGLKPDIGAPILSVPLTPPTAPQALGNTPLPWENSAIPTTVPPPGAAPRPQPVDPQKAPVQPVSPEISQQQQLLLEERRKLEEEKRRIAAERERLKQEDQSRPRNAPAAPSETRVPKPMCPNCQRENLPGKRFCTTCGAPLAFGPSQPPPRPPQPAPRPPNGYMPASGAAQPPATNNAGWMPANPYIPQPASVAAPAKLCPNCGQQNEMRRKFCTNCGRPLPTI